MKRCNLYSGRFTRKLIIDQRCTECSKAALYIKHRMKSAWIFILVSFAFQLGAQEDSPLPKGVKSVTVFRMGNDSTELKQVSQTLYDRKGNKTTAIAFDTTLYMYDRKGNLTMEMSGDTVVYKYDRKRREIERGIIQDGVYTRWSLTEYDRRGRLTRWLSEEEEITFLYAGNGWVTTLNHYKEEHGAESWFTQVVNEKGELMKYVECYKSNDTALVERIVSDSVAVRKIGDSLYKEHYAYGFLDAISVHNARGAMTRSEWINTGDDSRDSCITHYRYDKSGHLTMTLTYKVDRRTGALSVPVLHTYKYDAKSRLVNSDGARGESWTYNKAGQLTEHSKDDDITLYSYNSTGQCIEERRYRRGRLIDRTVTRIEMYPARR